MTNNVAAGDTPALDLPSAGRQRQAPAIADRYGRGARLMLVGAGLLLLALGAMLDIGHHAGVSGLTAERVGHSGHLVTLAGMLLVARGVALAAVFRRR